MKTPLNILVTEDSSTDFRMLVRHLQQQGLDARCHRVATVKKLNAALDQGGWNIVICDYNVPGMAFDEVLSRVRERNPELPLVLMSGSIGEERAVELLKQGVWDFVLKDSVARLVPVIDRSLREAQQRCEQRMADAEIARLNRLYATLSQINGSIIRVKSREELFQEVCTTMVKYGGYKMAWIGSRDPETQQVIPVARAGDHESYLSAIRVYADDRPEGRGPVGACIREGRRSVFNDFRTVPPTWLWREKAIAHGLKAMVALPIRFNGEVREALAVYAEEAGVFQDKEVALLEEAVEDISFALDHLVQDEKRQRAEVAQRESEEQVRLLLTSAAEGIFGLDMKGNFTFCNPAALSMLGYASALDLLGKNMHALIHHSQPNGKPLSADDSGVRRSLLRKKGHHSDREVYWRADGTCFPVEYWAYPIRRNDVMIGAVVTFFDITERKLAEEIRARLAAVVEQSSESIVITDLTGAITYVNPTFERITGYTPEEVIGKNPRILKSGKQDTAHYQRMWDTLSRGRAWQGRFINKRKDGSLYHEDTTISPVRDTAGNIVSYVAIKLDVTHEVEMEAQLRQSQKMEAIGVLAGGVAHEINNPVFGIKNYAQLITEGLPADQPLHKYAGEILKETDRIAVIVKNLLAFARQDRQEHGPTNLNDVINATLSLIRTVMKHDQITLVVNVPEDLPQVACRGQQIQQVLMNLMTNARDALNEKYPAYHEDKIIRITAALFERDGRRWVRTTVEDHGRGIPPEVHGRIFDPFYTTKPTGKGTGLGLSISYGIVKEHQGELHFETEPGQGTRFHMDLPVNG